MATGSGGASLHATGMSLPASITIGTGDVMFSDGDALTNGSAALHLLPILGAA
jgi:hypothetical protein